MVEYQLEKAHPQYQPLIESILIPLCEKYPRCPIKLVRLYDLKEGDRSIANADNKGVISLNPYWFIQSPDVLNAASHGDRMINVGDGILVAYHGDMLDEPNHVMVHEFGHLLTDALPGWKEFITPLWQEALNQPELTPAGYGLTNIIEYWAELFAAVELGISDNPHVMAMRDFLMDKG